MKKYLENLNTRPAHEKRRFSMRLSGVITAIVFVGWFSTLGVRFATAPAVATDSSPSGLVAATAAATEELQKNYGELQSSFASQFVPVSPETATTAPKSAPATVLSGSSESTR